DRDEDSEARSRPTRGVLTEESGDICVPRRRRHRRHCRAAFYASNEDQSLRGGERTGSSRTRRTGFERLALDNSMDMYVPRMSEHLGTMDLRERLNQRMRETQVHCPLPQQGCKLALQMGPALPIALVIPEW
ncbi:hypothetical protein TorRG33x02_288810, partial [Trema orientale]